MSLRVLIADDEPLSLSRLRRFVEAEACEVIAEAKNGDELVRGIELHLPDLVVSDIRMPSKTGLEAALEVCKSLETPPAFIFCTAYPDYAIQAFDALAVGYLIKPIEKDKLSAAIQRVSKLNQTQLDAAMNAVGGKTRVLIKTVGKFEALNLEEVDYFQASDKSVFAYLGERSVVLDKSLKELEDELGDEVVRVHRSLLVNVSRIERIFQEDGRGSFVETMGEHKLPISRRLLPAVKQQFKDSIS